MLLDEESTDKKRDKYAVARENMTAVFNNAFNENKISDLTPNEYDLLMLIIAKLKEKGGEEVEIPFDEIRQVLDQKNHYSSRMVKIGVSLWDKIKMTDYAFYSRGDANLRTGGVLLFRSFNIDPYSDSIKVVISPEIQYFVNDFDKGNYTSVKIDSIRKNRSIHSKRLFVKLSQYASTGMYTVGRDELIEMLDSPDYVKNDVTRFHNKILAPAIESCSKYFPGLKLEKIKRGRKIVSYKFTFKRVSREKLSTYNLKDVTPDESLTKSTKASTTKKKATPTMRSDEELLSAPAGTKFTEAEQRRIIGLRQGR